MKCVFRSLNASCGGFVFGYALLLMKFVWPR